MGTKIMLLGTSISLLGLLFCIQGLGVIGTGKLLFVFAGVVVSLIGLFMQDKK